MATARDDTRNEIQGNYPSGSIEIIPDQSLKEVCDELTQELSKMLKNTLEMHPKVTGLNTQGVEMREAHQLNMKTYREALIAQRYTGGIPTFFETRDEDKQKVIKTEFMIGALKVSYNNSDISPAKLLAISGDFPLYTRIEYEKTGKFIGAIKDIITIKKAKEGREAIKGKITDKKALVLIEAAIKGTVDDKMIDYWIKGVVTDLRRPTDNGSISGIITGEIYETLKEMLKEKGKPIARIDNLPLNNNCIKGEITIDTTDDKKPFEFEYDGFKLINDPGFHKGLLQNPVYNLFGELLPGTRLLKTCAAQKLFAYLTLKHSEKRGSEKITALKDIKSIGMYETFFIHSQLKPQNRFQSTTHAVNSCNECKKVLPAMTMVKKDK